MLISSLAVAVMFTDDLLETVALFRGDVIPTFGGILSRTPGVGEGVLLGILVGIDVIVAIGDGVGLPHSGGWPSGVPPNVVVQYAPNAPPSDLSIPIAKRPGLRIVASCPELAFQALNTLCADE